MSRAWERNPRERTRTFPATSSSGGYGPELEGCVLDLLLVRVFLFRSGGVP